jgi:hypothetical protein
MSLLKKIFGVFTSKPEEKHPLDFTERTARITESPAVQAAAAAPVAPAPAPLNIVPEETKEVVAIPVDVPVAVHVAPVAPVTVTQPAQTKAVNKPAVKKATAGRKKKAK